MESIKPQLLGSIVLTVLVPESVADTHNFTEWQQKQYNVTLIDIQRVLQHWTLTEKGREAYARREIIRENTVEKTQLVPHATGNLGFGRSPTLPYSTSSPSM
jgi:hypothetical protein